MYYYYIFTTDLKTNKIISVVGLLLILIFIHGCSTNACGLFGATATYHSEIVIDRPIEPLEVAKGDTLILRPETHFHIDYTYTGGSNCDGEDYKNASSDFKPIVENDSLALAEAFHDDSESKWGGKELKIRIIGKEMGETILTLEIEYLVKDTHHYYESQDYKVDLTIEESSK